RTTRAVGTPVQALRQTMRNCEAWRRGTARQGSGGISVSCPSGPTNKDVSSTRSSMLRASGPYAHSCRSIRGAPGGGGMCPVPGTRFDVGLKPYTPQKCAGIRIEPLRSLPMSNGASLAATAAAPPPLDPPVVRSRFHGLLLRPKISLFVCRLIASGGTLVFPSRIAPAAFSRAATVLSACGTCPASGGWPAVVRRPCVSKQSFNVNGTPCSGPQGCPRASAASAARARSSAPSPSSVTMALSAGLRRSIRSSRPCTRSSAEHSRDRIARASSTAVASIAVAMARSPSWRKALSCALQRRPRRATLEPCGQARMRVELDSECGADHEPAGGGNIHEREVAEQVVARFEPRLDRIQAAVELPEAVLGCRRTAVLRLVRKGGVHAVVHGLHHVRAEFGHRPHGPAQRIGTRLRIAAGPQPLVDAVLVAQVQQDRAGLEEAQLGVLQRGHFAVRVDRKILGRPMLALRGVELDVLVGKSQFLQCPGNAGAGAARPGVKLDRHHRLLVGTRAGSVHPKGAAC